MSGLRYELTVQIQVTDCGRDVGGEAVTKRVEVNREGGTELAGLLRGAVIAAVREVLPAEESVDFFDDEPTDPAGAGGPTRPMVAAGGGE
jgi:hypothetical protein